MKTLLVSDIHGVSYYVEKLKEIYEKEKPDILIVLGDLYKNYYSYDSPYDDNIKENLEELFSKKNVYVFKGNCDSDIDIKTSNFTMYEYLVLEIDKRKLFLSHGNKYNPNRLPNLQFDIMAYGHTHIGKIEKKNNLIFVNPGSISYPRGNTTNSYAIIDNDEIFLKDVFGNIINYLKL